MSGDVTHEEFSEMLGQSERERHQLGEEYKTITVTSGYCVSCGLIPHECLSHQVSVMRPDDSSSVTDLIKSSEAQKLQTARCWAPEEFLIT